MNIDVNTVWMIGTAVGMPLLTLLIAILHKTRRDESGALWNALKKQSEELTDFRIHVAEKYVTVPRLEKLETSMADAMKRIEDKIDRIMAANRG